MARGRGEQSVANECDEWSWLIAVEPRGEEAQTQTANQLQPQSDDRRPDAPLPSRRRDQANKHIEHDEGSADERVEGEGMEMEADERPLSHRLQLHHGSAPLHSSSPSLIRRRSTSSYTPRF